MDNIFDIKRNIESFGIWYALYRHGFTRAWPIWVAYRMIKRDDAAQRAHADWHYNR